MTILGLEELTVARASEGGEWSSGVFVPAEITSLTVYGSVQPVKVTGTELLPQAARTRGAMWLYVDQHTELYTVDLSWQTPPDRVTRKDGKEYEVHGVGDWTQHKAGVPHRVYVLTEVGADE